MRSYLVFTELFFGLVTVMAPLQRKKPRLKEVSCLEAWGGSHHVSFLRCLTKETPPGWLQTTDIYSLGFGSRKLEVKVSAGPFSL
jgi:hypothetical protein